MLSYVRILLLCTLAGYCLASLFVAPAAANIGAFKGLVVGMLVTWAEWKSKHHKALVTRLP